MLLSTLSLTSTPKNLPFKRLIEKGNHSREPQKRLDPKEPTLLQGNHSKGRRPLLLLERRARRVPEGAGPSQQTTTLLPISSERKFKKTSVMLQLVRLEVVWVHRVQKETD